MSEAGAPVDEPPPPAPEPLFKGGLPDGCPPPDAQPLPECTLLRLVANGEGLSAEDFRSGEEEGRTRPGNCDLCTWKACSFWIETADRQQLIDITRLPKHSHKKFVAFVSVTAAAGRWKPHPANNEHLSVWMFMAFEPHNNVSKIEPVEPPEAVP